jgi:sigma-B regulation protein RsbU (phosphoserine phosphatase)
MSDASDPHELLRLILGHARRTTHVERAVVLSRAGLEFPQYRVVLSAECGTPDGLREGKELAGAGGMLADLLYAGDFRITTPAPDPSDPAHDLLRGHSTLIAFPLFDRGRSMGMVVLLGSSRSGCSISELCMLAVMSALLQRADRAHALTRELEATCRTLDAELAAAASVQRSLLPRPAPSSANVGVASFYRPAHYAGGDYYDAGTMPDGSLGVLIADVSGHGAAAAVLMAILRTVVHDEVDRVHISSPAALLDHANNHLCAIGLPSPGAFITAFAGTLDTKTGRLTYSCAGHPPPRLLRAADGRVTPVVGAGSIPLGILADRAPRPEVTIKLEPGDLLLFFSDGITEAPSPSGGLFSDTRLDQALLALPRPVSSDTAVQAVMQAVDAFTGPAAPSDDQTLLAVRWQPDQVATRPDRAAPRSAPAEPPAAKSSCRP